MSTVRYSDLSYTNHTTGGTEVSRDGKYVNRTTFSTLSNYVLNAPNDTASVNTAAVLEFEGDFNMTEQSALHVRNSQNQYVQSSGLQQLILFQDADVLFDRQSEWDPNPVNTFTPKKEGFYIVSLSYDIRADDIDYFEDATVGTMEMNSTVPGGGEQVLEYNLPMYVAERTIDVAMPVKMTSIVNMAADGILFFTVGWTSNLGVSGYFIMENQNLTIFKIG